MKTTSREAELEAAITAFLAKFALVLPAIQTAFLMQHIHGGNYTGPTLDDELRRFEELVELKLVDSGDAS